MTPIQIRHSVQTLQAQGHSLREISRLLGISRNTVRRILRGHVPAQRGPALDEAAQQRLAEVYARAQGNAVRMGQILKDEDGIDCAYSTLTRRVRQAELRAPPKRAGEYHFEPGEEMQHDTSPHRVTIGGRAVIAQCAGLVLACSRYLFIAYFPKFTRFEAKHFLLEASLFMQGTASRCVIDNTSVVLAGGSGAEAVIAPEMEAFAATLGFRFLAHRVRHSDRKGRIERPFFWVESGFLPGRSFTDFDDLNAQARRWCAEVANSKPKRILGCSPEQAWRRELAHLRPLPAVLPPVYEVLERVVDLYGFVSVDTNRYSAPERLVGRQVTVLKYHDRIEIHHRGAAVATHRRLIDQRDARHVIDGHHTTAQRASRQPPIEVQLLRGEHEVLQRYAKALAQQPNRGLRALRRLLQIKRTYPREPFLAAVEQALKFRLFDLARLERLVLRHVAGDFFALCDDDDDDDHA